MTALATDTFNRANTTTLGSNWTQTEDFVANIGVVSNTARNNGDSVDCSDFYNAVTWPNDHYSQAVLTLDAATGSAEDGPAVAVRMASGAITYYRVVWSRNAANKVSIAKKVAGGYTLLSQPAATMANGDTLRLEAQSTTLRAVLNGSTLGTTTDSSIAAGNAGLSYSSDNSSKVATWDNWEGGDFSFLAQVLQPVSDTSVGTWLNEAATTPLYTSIDEATASDTDYAESVAGPSSETFEVGLLSVGDPLDNTNHTASVRGLIDTAVGGSMSLVTELRNAGAAFGTPITWTDTLTTTAATFDHALTTGQADQIHNAAAYGNLRMRFTATQASGSAPTLVAAGTAAFTATSGATLAPGLPAGFAAGDIHILIAARSDNTAMTSLAGWTQIAALTGNNTAAQRVEVWWRRAVGGDTAPTVTFGTGTTVRGARIIGIRGAPTSGDPFDTGTGASTFLANAAAATISFTDLTTTVDNCFILVAGAYEDDPTTITTMTNYTQPAGAVSGSSLGNDMMLCYEHRTLATAGAAGASSVTVSGGTFANSPSVGLVMAIKPVANASKARVTWAQLAVPFLADDPELYGHPFGARGQSQMQQLLAQ